MRHAPLAHPLSTCDQTPSKRTVTYRPCMPRISVHRYVSLESRRHPSILVQEPSGDPHEYPSIQPIMFSRGCPDIARGIERDPSVNKLLSRDFIIRSHESKR